MDRAHPVIRWTGLFLVAVTLPLLAGACRGDDKPPASSVAVDGTPGARPAGPLTGIAIPTATPALAEDSPSQPRAADEDAAPSGPEFPEPGESAQLVRLVIPKARVDHRLVTKGLNDRREMEDPGGKDDIAWYNFSTMPGFGSNAVFSGHVDWYTGERGVFWFLRDLKEGDDAEIVYSDGSVLKYRVSRVQVYGANDAPVTEITGPTSKDVLTMITCDGVFLRNSGDYTQRRVVWAERVA